MLASRAPAPGDLRLVQEFENTADLEQGTDQLGTPESLAAWLDEAGLLDDGAPALTSDDVERAVAVREAVRALLFANNGADPDPGAVETLNRLADGARLRVRFDADARATLVPACNGVDAAIGRLLAAINAAMTDGTWARLKACRDDVCQWAFYDHSKNRSGAWCTMASCGNRSKARAYRERQAT
jgi:predicted RNA-binding Zn ribbon-like protein